MRKLVADASWVLPGGLAACPAGFTFFAGMLLAALGLLLEIVVSPGEQGRLTPDAGVGIVSVFSTGGFSSANRDQR
jgi:hypothetical protein